MPGAGIGPVRRSFVPLRAAQPVSFGLQEPVHGLLHTGAHGLVNMALQLLLIDTNRPGQGLGGIVRHGGLLSVW